MQKHKKWINKKHAEKLNARDALTSKISERVTDQKHRGAIASIFFVSLLCSCRGYLSACLLDRPTLSNGEKSRVSLEKSAKSAEKKYIFVS